MKLVDTPHRINLHQLISNQFFSLQRLAALHLSSPGWMSNLSSQIYPCSSLPLGGRQDDVLSIHCTTTTWLDVKSRYLSLTRLNHHKSHGWALVAHSSSAPTSKPNQIIITCHLESNTHRLPTCSSLWSSFIVYTFQHAGIVSHGKMKEKELMFSPTLIAALGENHAHTCVLCVWLRSLASESLPHYSQSLLQKTLSLEDTI